MLPYWCDFRKPPNYVGTPWLSVLDIYIDFSYVRDVCVVFYSSFVDNSGVRLRRNWSQFLKSIMYQRLLKNQLKRWRKHLVKRLSHQMTRHGK